MLGLGLKVRILSSQIPPRQTFLSKLHLLGLPATSESQYSWDVLSEPKGGERGTGSGPQQHAKQEAAKT